MVDIWFFGIIDYPDIDPSHSCDIVNYRLNGRIGDRNRGRFADDV